MGNLTLFSSSDISQTHASRSCGACVKASAIFSKSTKFCCEYKKSFSSIYLHIIVVLKLSTTESSFPWFSFIGRLMQLEVLIHPFFDELRDPNICLPNGHFLPPLFNFKQHGRTHSLNIFLMPSFLSNVHFGDFLSFFVQQNSRALLWSCWGSWFQSMQKNNVHSLVCDVVDHHLCVYATHWGKWVNNFF